MKSPPTSGGTTGFGARTEGWGIIGCWSTCMPFEFEAGARAGAGARDEAGGLGLHEDAGFGAVAAFSAVR